MFAQGTSVEIQEITTTEDLGRLRGEWSALWDRASDTTPFQAPEWLIPWWTHFGEGSLWALALREEGSLVGLLPLYLHRKSGSPVREALFLGTGISDYLGGIFEPGFEAAGTDAFAEFLIHQSDQWDSCDFHQLRQDTLLLKVSLPAEWLNEGGIQNVCPVLPLPAQAVHLDNFVPLQQLESLRQARFAAGNGGRFKVERLTETNFEELFYALLRLHRAQAQRFGQAGLPADKLIQDFYADAACGFLDRGFLRLYGLRIDDRIVAALFGFSHARRFYHYLSAFDPAYTQYSLGSLLIGHAVEEAICEGCKEFDFLRGRETYKYLWGGRDQFNFRRRIHKNSVFPYGRK